MSDSPETSRTRRRTTRVAPRKRRTTKRIKPSGAARKVDRAGALRAVLAELSTGQPVGRMLRASLDLAAPPLHADVLCVLLVDETGRYLTAAAGYGIDPMTVEPLFLPRDRGAGSLAEEDGRLVFAHDPRLTADDATASADPQRALCVPIIFRERVMGFLVAARSRRGEPFASQDRQLVADLANAFSLAAGGGIPREDIMTRERMERDLQFAHMLQTSFATHEPRSEDGLCLTVRRNASLETEGDFYDGVRLPGGRFAVAVGHTSGHGLDAGFNVARVLAELRAILASIQSPAQALGELNHLLATEERRSLLVSVVLAVVDGRAGALSLAGAGAGTPYLLRREPASVAAVQMPRASPMGILPGWRCREVDCGFPPGGQLVLFSQGVRRWMAGEEDADGQKIVEAALADAAAQERPAAEVVAETLHAHAPSPLSGGEFVICSIARAG